MAEATLVRSLWVSNTAFTFARSAIRNCNNDNMNKHLEHYFCEKYPKIFRDMYKDPKQTCMAWGVSCGDGWFFLLDHLCLNIQHHIDQQAERIKEKWAQKGEKPIPQVVAHQIKEKFGSLRFYHEGGDEQIEGMIRLAESITNRLCENCGKWNQDVGRTKGWIQNLCTECAAEYKKPIQYASEQVRLWKKVMKSRANAKRAWKGQDEPFTKKDLIPPYVKNKPKKKKA